MRFESPEDLKLDRDTWEDVRLGGYIPEEHIKDMKIDGIDVSIVYPTTGLILFSVPDSDLLTHTFKLYNDWVAEFCSAYPKVLKGIAMVNVDDVGSGVKELERCAKLGFVGAIDYRVSPRRKVLQLARVRTPVGRGPGPADAPQPPHRHEPPGVRARSSRTS